MIWSEKKKQAAWGNDRLVQINTALSFGVLTDGYDLSAYTCLKVPHLFLFLIYFIISSSRVILEFKDIWRHNHDIFKNPKWPSETKYKYNLRKGYLKIYLKIQNNSGKPPKMLFFTSPTPLVTKSQTKLLKCHLNLLSFA